MKWEVIGFRRAIDNLITVSNGIRVNNDSEVEITGGEFTVGIPLSASWRANFDVVYTDSKGPNGQEIPNIPGEMFKANFVYSSKSLPFGANISVLHVGEIVSDVGGFFPNGEIAKYGEYEIVDVSLHYRLGREERIGLGLRLENILDETYATRVSAALSNAGDRYIFDSLGVPFTAHLSLSYDF